MRSLSFLSFALAVRSFSPPNRALTRFDVGWKRCEQIYRPNSSAADLCFEPLQHLPAPTLSAGVLSYASSHGKTDVLVLVHRDSLAAYSFPTPSQSLHLLQTVPFPHGAAHPSAHPPHASFSSSSAFLLVHIAAASGPRGKTRPVLYRFGESGASGGEPAFFEVPLLGAGGGESARSAVFSDSLGEAALVRPLVALAKPVSATNGAEVAVAMEEDEDDLYGGGAAAKESKPVAAEQTKAESRFVQPAEDGAGWEWLVEVDAKGDLSVRSCSLPFRKLGC